MNGRQSCGFKELKKITVVMTACIDPSTLGRKTLVREDVRVRLNDYARALRFWLTLPDVRISTILFLDNSGFPLDELEHLSQLVNPYGRKTEFISSSRCKELPYGLHYGYSEFRELHLGLTTSRCLSETEYLAKTTGRYTFPAVSRLLDRLPVGLKIAIDARKDHLDTALFVSSKQFYCQWIANAYTEMCVAPRKQMIEHVLWDRLIGMRGAPDVLLRFPCNCEPSGIGGNGDNLDAPNKKVKAAIRAVARIVLPWWWC